MATYQLRTFKDFVDSVREEVKIQSSDTSTINRIKRDLNMLYMNEIAPADRWNWLRRPVDLRTEPALYSGTISVISNDNEATLSFSPADSKKDWYLRVDDFEEVYRIKAHTAGTATIKLETPYMGLTNTAARFWIWTDAVALPSTIRETQEVWTDYDFETLQALGYEDFRRTQKLDPSSEGRPQYYTTTGYIDPDPYETITGLPAVATRASTGYIRSIKFAATLGADEDSLLIKAGDRLLIKDSGHPDYNGEIEVRSVVTGDVTNDTIQFSTTTRKAETATAAVSTSVQLINQEEDLERFRQILVFPALSKTKTTLHVEGIVDVRPLIADTDEPLIPMEDRMVLLYGALWKAWSRERNPEEAQRNFQLFQRKMGQMMGKMEDGIEYPSLEVSENYLRIKRVRKTRNVRRS